MNCASHRFGTSSVNHGVSFGEGARRRGGGKRGGTRGGRAGSNLCYREGEHGVGVCARHRHHVHVLLPGVHEGAHAEVHHRVSASVLAVDDLRLESGGHVAAESGERRRASASFSRGRAWAGRLGGARVCVGRRRRDASWVRVTHSTSSRYWRSKITSPRRLRKYRALSATGGLRAIPCHPPPPLAIFAGSSKQVSGRVPVPRLPCERDPGAPSRGSKPGASQSARCPDEPEAGSRVGRAVVPGYY